MPVEIEVHTVPHFKATINTKVDPEQQGYSHMASMASFNVKGPKGPGPGLFD